jgi:hypothetical protein
MNVQSIVIYAVLTSAMLLLVLGVVAYFHWKKTQPTGYDYSPIQMMEH